MSQGPDTGPVIAGRLSCFQIAFLLVKTVRRLKGAELSFITIRKSTFRWLVISAHCKQLPTSVHSVLEYEIWFLVISYSVISVLFACYVIQFFPSVCPGLYIFIPYSHTFEMCH